jgi:hypothetical protein
MNKKEAVGEGSPTASKKRAAKGRGRRAGARE